MVKDLEERFWSKVDIQGPNDCWLWTAYKDKNGYGNFWFNGKTIKAHRMVWSFINKEIANGICACHTCDTPPCVNPSHLWLGTPQNNTDDMMRKGRYINVYSLQTHCKRGHEYTVENTRIRERNDGFRRECKECDKIYGYTYRRRQKELVNA